MDESLKDKLLSALQAEKEELVNELANKLFVDHRGRRNSIEINMFEAYAPCRIFPLKQDNVDWLVGGIRYGGKTFEFKCS